MAGNEPFLSKSEKNQIQSKYENICDNMKPEELILKFHQANFISRNEKARIKNLPDPDKCQFIVDEVLMKATYEQLCDIRTILIKTEQSSHIAIARLLPTRGEDINYNYSSNRINQTSESLPAHMEQYGLERRRDSDPVALRPAFPVQEESRRYSGGSEPDALLSSIVIESPETYQAAGNPSSSKDGIFKRLTNSFKKKRSSKSSPVISQPHPPRLGYYGVKPGNDEESGKALCVIIANFTDDLEGYEKDVESIVDLHRDVLRHEHVFEGTIPGTDKSLKNLTRTELLDVVLVIQNFLTNPMSGHMIDRFFLYLLSHGDEDGIMTCKQGSTTEVENAIDPRTGKVIKVRTQMQEIIDLFTHDKVKNLKGFPKVFINQSCRGSEVLRAAGPGEDTVDLHKPHTWEPPRAKLAIGADVIVGEATSDSNFSWVSKHGSLYIQCLVEVIQEYFEIETLYDMLVEVNKRIAHKIKRGLNPADNSIVPASQMPGVHSKLTQKFYLACPKSNFYL